MEPQEREDGTDTLRDASGAEGSVVTGRGPAAAEDDATVVEQESSLKDFFDISGDLDTEVETILNNPGLLKEEQLIALHAILQHYLPEQAQYGPDFDFTKEITAQITSIRALRMHVMNSNGTLKDNVSTREAKEVITASATLLTSLMKHHGTIQNFERQRAIEQSTVEAIKTLPKASQEQFFETFNAILDAR